VRPLHDERTARAVAAERTVLAALGGGCSIPLGVLATGEGEDLTMVAALCSLDGRVVIRETAVGDDPEPLGLAMAERLLARARDEGIDLPDSHARP
jgi:hydroxymethylbilane synthase